MLRSVEAHFYWDSSPEPEGGDRLKWEVIVKVALPDQDLVYTFRVVNRANPPFNEVPADPLPENGHGHDPN
jgi:hypothetical protein